MALELAWKSQHFGPSAPNIVVKHVGDKVSARVRNTYGVYAVISSQGHSRPVGAGRGLTLEDAIDAAKRCNANMHAPSEGGQVYA